MQAVPNAGLNLIFGVLCLALCACASAGPEDMSSQTTNSVVPPSMLGAGGAAGLPGNEPRLPIPGGNPSTPVPTGTAGTSAPAVGGAGVGGNAGVAGSGVIDMGLAGTGGVGAGGVAGGPAPTGDGSCCADGNCLCHGPAPTELTSAKGPFKVATFEMPTGSVYYPTDAEPPFAAVAVCGGFLNTGAEMLGWGDFYASHGIVTVITWTLGSDIPDIRAIKLVDSLNELKTEAAKAGNPLMGKLSDRMGTSGYSMGGGGTTIATTSTMSLRSSVGLAAWGPVGAGIVTPTLFLCGLSDTVAPCGGSEGAYTSMPETTQKMVLRIPGTTHFNWFGPQDAGSGTSGSAALAWQKVFLEGDERWLPILKGITGDVTTNLK